jgi:hypothetical protein
VNLPLALTQALNDEREESCDLAKGRPTSYGELRTAPLLETRRGARVFGHPQVIKDQPDVTGELPHFLRNASHALGFDDSDGKTTEPGDVFRAVAGAYAAAVFIKIPVQDVVTAVFNGPVTTIDGKELWCVSFVRGSAGDAVGDIFGLFPALFLYDVSFDDKRLPDVGEVEVGVEFGRGPDFSGFNPAVIRGIIGNEIRLLTILKIEFDIVEESGLIAFDGEVIMGLTLQAHIIGERALGEQGIGGDVFVVDIDGIEQGDGYPDFVGALPFLSAFSRYRGDFFWV